MAPGDAVAAVDEVEMGIEMDDMDRLLVRIGRNRRHGDRMVAAENIGHGLGVEQSAHGKLGIGETALRVGIDDIAIAGIDDLDLFRRQICHFVFEIEDALRAEAMEHRHLANGPRAETGADAIAGSGVDRHAQHGDVGTIELVPIGAGGLRCEGRKTDEGKVHALGHVAAVELGCHGKILSWIASRTGRADRRPAGRR